MGEGQQKQFLVEAKEFNYFPDEMAQTADQSALIDAFVFDMIGLLGHESLKYPQFVETIKIFKKYLRTDPKVFKRFKASLV